MEVELNPLRFARPRRPGRALAERELIDAALARLDPGHRAVVALHYLLGMPMPMVATPWASRSAPRSPGCTTPSRRCGRSSPSPTRSPPASPEGRSHDDRPPLRRAAHRAPRGALPGARSRVSRRGPCERRPRSGSVPPGPSPEGGFPWPTSPAGPRSCRPSRGGRSGWPCSSSPSWPPRSPSPARAGRRSPPPFGLAGNGVDRVGARRRHLHGRPCQRDRPRARHDTRHRPQPAVLQGRVAPRVPPPGARPRRRSSTS